MRTSRFDVWLADTVIGSLDVTGDHTRFAFSPGYWEDASRRVLGLRFEDVPGERTSASLRVPPWFSNLLPEGPLREWVVQETGTAAQRELPLLVRLGADLPGAVRVLPAEVGGAWDPEVDPGRAAAPPMAAHSGSWRFSLAGVGLKFSALRSGDRLVVPASGVGGDWIVKLPDAAHPGLPRVEMAIMEWAHLVGVDVPERTLVAREALSGVPDAVWPAGEDVAYAIRRFDRGPSRELVHIEDLAQVRGFWPEDRYRGSYETAAALVHRQRDDVSLVEFVRRLVMCVISGNGDAHLKNFSLIYADGRTPRLAPAYDLVSTAPYAPPGVVEDLAMTFNRTRSLSEANWRGFRRLEGLLQVEHLDLVGVAAVTAQAALEAWPQVSESLTEIPRVRTWLADHVEVAARSFMP